MKKWVAAPLSAKIEKMTALGPQFFPNIQFLIDFGAKNPPQGVIDIGQNPFL